MPKLLQIDSCLGILSTGRISESIARLAMNKGWECHIVHGARCVGTTVQNHYQVSSLFGEYLHFAESLLFDNHGLGARFATKRIIERIKQIQPDVIQLHCIHGYYINYKYLFEYLNTSNIPVVWTFHDCWAFTGHCAHFISASCYKWKQEGCHDCPLTAGYPKALVDRSKRNYELKKKIFSGCSNMHIVAVSDWLASFAKESFMRGKDIRVINNGVDIHTFYPCSEKSQGKFKVLGVASAWGGNKGLYDFFELRNILPVESFDITLVGFSKEQLAKLPKNINGIMRTNSVKELAQLYSEANVFVNPTYADSFPTVNMEALACGTPVITYRTGGSPEIIDEQTGRTVELGDVASLADVILHMKNHPLSSDLCRKRAKKYYNKDERFNDYVNLYDSLIRDKN